MSNPSRFDRAELLSATGGWFFRNECLPKGINLFQCEVRTKEERGPLLPGTKVLLLLGRDAYALWTGDTEHTLGEVRGSIYYVNGIPAIPSYLPQDCMDVVDYESEHNELLQGKDYTEAESAIAGDKADKRRHGVTSRSNWRFWLQRDTDKCVRILFNDGKIPESPGYFKPHYNLYPSAQSVIAELEGATDKQLYFDIETDEHFGLKCIGYSLDDDRITVIPILDYQYKLAYPEVAQILRAFSLAATRNTLVSHNGSGFDWIVLPWKYNILLGNRFYDTMLATHRCYPDIEKSLGHCTSLWTYEPFHKDEGSGSYGTYDDMRRLMQYCGKDVYTMMLIRRAIDAHAKSIPGLTESVAQVNESVGAYNLMTLMGIRYKQEMLDAVMQENDELMMQYNRIIDFLVGKQAVDTLNRKSKKSIAGSNTKCVQYFHDMLGYKVVMHSKKTMKPSLAKKAMYKLRIRNANPVIDYILNYREVAKESGSLKFTPWTT